MPSPPSSSSGLPSQAPGTSFALPPLASSLSRPSTWSEWLAGRSDTTRHGVWLRKVLGRFHMSSPLRAHWYDKTIPQYVSSSHDRLYSKWGVLRSVSGSRWSALNGQFSMSFRNRSTIGAARLLPSLISTHQCTPPLWSIGSCTLAILICMIWHHHCRWIYSLMLTS